MHADRSSQTAEGATFIRTLHQQLPAAERVLHDPWVVQLALFGQRWMARIPFLARQCLRKFPRMVDYVPVRDRFGDEVIDKAVGGGTRQVVILGAGLDTISYRTLSRHPDCVLYEVDHPATQAMKLRRAKRLAAKFGHAIRYVAADFEVDDFREKLITAGFQPNQPSVFIWMGVIYYLSEDAVKQTLSRARDLMTVGSPLALDFWPPSLTEATGDPNFEARRKTYAKMGETLKFGIEPRDLADFVRPLGYGVNQVESINALCRKYVRREMQVAEGMSAAAIVAEPHE
ncbi:MAG: SAM-dependent methyltransferase [Planctomycetaceae bacterium]|nr:SAM-dependent methyltransferase [Planctomycetaceae bacterium]